MRSFNLTCFASRQAIAPGNQCVVVAIRQKQTYWPVEMTYQGVTVRHYGVANGLSELTSFWTPVSHFLEAHYADYGRVQISETKSNLAKLLQLLRDALRNTPVIKEGENTTHETPFDLAAFMQEDAPEVYRYATAARDEALASFPKALQKALKPDAEEFNADPKVLFKQAVKCWDYLYEATQRQRMFWASGSNELRPLGFAVMHQRAWQRLVKHFGTNGRIRDRSISIRDSFDRALHATKAGMQEIDAQACAGGNPTQSVISKHAAFSRFFTEAIEPLQGAEDLRYVGERQALAAIGDEFVEGRLTQEQLFDALQPWWEARYVCAALSALNLYFEPVRYEPRYYDNDAGDLYWKFVGEVNGEISKDLQDRGNR